MTGAPKNKVSVMDSEKMAGVIVNTDDWKILHSMLTRSQWDRLLEDLGYISVDWEAQTAKLTEQNIPITRNNMRTGGTTEA